MSEQLTKSECEYILSCLKHTRAAYEATEYPTYELKQQQLATLTAVEEKLRALRG
jgi:hypothetical protein